MDIVIRATVMYVFLFALLRAVGRREMNSLEPFDVFLLVVMGDLSQQAVTQSDMSVTGGILAVSTIALLTYGTSVLRFHVPRMRKVLDGAPLVLITDGKLVEPNLRRERITRDELLEQARLNQIVRLEDVRWAVLETDGQISFIPAKG